MPRIIYGLCDPDDPNKTIRYVGYSSQGLTKRLVQHVSEAKRGLNHRHHWINAIVARGMTPAIVVLEEVTAENWQEREVFWISQYPNLVNSTCGGEGLVNPSAEVRARIGAKVSADLQGNQRRKGKPHSAEDRAKISAGVRTSEKFKNGNLRRRGKPGHKCSDETKEKMRLSKTGKKRPWTAEWKANIKAASIRRIGTRHSPETIAKMSAVQKGHTRNRGIKRSASFKTSIAIARTGTRLITDGSCRRFLKGGKSMPDGWSFAVKNSAPATAL